MMLPRWIPFLVAAWALKKGSQVALVARHPPQAEEAAIIQVPDPGPDETAEAEGPESETSAPSPRGN